MHFTYQDPKQDTTLLKQGDILKRTPDLVDVLSRYHPHYAQEAYTHFQVLTQSCDLVLGRRGSSCKARYINIAAIRSISEVVGRVIEEKASNLTIVDNEKYVSEQHLYELKSFVIKLLNNNEADYFFLKAEPDYGLIEDSCSFLRLSVALRADEHYQKCLGAKVLELSDVFQAKLGWSVGNLYSRVGTDDYTDGVGISKNQLGKLARTLLDNYITFVPEAKYAAFREVAAKSSNLDEIEARVTQIIQERQDAKLKALVTVVSSALDLDADAVRRLTNTLSQDVTIMGLL